MLKKIIIFNLLLIYSSIAAFSQGFLHVQGDSIVNGDGENVILRGIGTGNWMLMEGYMMKTEGVAGTQHEIRAKLEELMGEQKTDEFFNYWLENHVTKADVDSMKAWGFNSVRVAMHYKWFTLPVEEELVAGSNTWLFKGFRMIDNLLDWCETNQMYLILDLHGAPGGQGKNADISDYDSSKPSLWESQANQDKTVALWRKLAERYANEPWIGGYDLINETNWTFSTGNNVPLRQLMVRITQAIREVDTNHIIFVEGNSFANDFTDLTPPWDDNMVYSFHKYWSGTTRNDLDWVLKIRDEYNVPLWLGESGENSNTWFTELITTCEENNIGWSWWPVKKNGINNVLFVELNSGYDQLVKYWKGETSVKPSATETWNAVKQWADNHKIENCRVQRDVIDAMIRQPHTDEVKPYRVHSPGKPIFFSDYDMGKNGLAYFDTDAAYYGGNYTAWNTGWSYRNDGVDIESCSDTKDTTNGYNVGWTQTGEWMRYSLHTDSSAIYTLKVRHASGSGGSKFKLYVNGVAITSEKNLPSTGGWQSWQTTEFHNIVLPAGNVKLRFYLTKGGSNFSYFKLTDPQQASHVAFTAVGAQTLSDGKGIRLLLNKDITSKDIDKSEFTLSINGIAFTPETVALDTSISNGVLLWFESPFYADNVLKLSYAGTSVQSGSQKLTTFDDLAVENTLPAVYGLPGKIEAENFAENQGFVLEDCSDAGGGKNTSYAAPGDYLTYRVNVTTRGIYNLSYRVASAYDQAEIVFQVGDGEVFTSLDTFVVTSTGGWQSWQTQTAGQVFLPQGYQFVRVLAKQGEHNLNWFQLDLVTNSYEYSGSNDVSMYPNPATTRLNVLLRAESRNVELMHIYNSLGICIRTLLVKQQNRVVVPLDGLPDGMYMLVAEGPGTLIKKKFMIVNQ